ncbi:NAD-dependent deacetylase [Paenibacillus phyllosphaerae]|uniref:NAD-dependent protein deacetylase n=1 Tax=Paenibacillus phyllosphaerae TaxID=274593 RepID=A0A7W5B0H3_9BACL|nr:NAD-dependent protein deacylase [Paenibacillus phyllosphaerae]MBB3112022.1 NAD-dependent deacetylase [Paenibacillus phyllosphaerae]
MEREIQQLKQLVQASDNIVFFGGAGVSTESQIPDFRSATGLYETEREFSHPPEVILSRSFFLKHPEQFYAFYRTKMVHKEAKPNPAHQVLAQWEAEGRLKAVITQNIDGLHQLAGSRNVLELHGSVHRNYCTRCRKSFDLDYMLSDTDQVPSCDACGGLVRPDVVLYEESLNMDTLLAARDYIAACDVLIVGGTSLTVNPAAGLVAEYEGDKLVLINMSATSFDRRANYKVADRIGKVLQALV